MKNQLFSTLFITGTIATIAPVAHAASARPASSTFYLYQGQPVLLETQTTEIAVVFKPQPKTRGTSAPLYRQLQSDLNQGGRSLTRLQVDPLGQQYAIVSTPGNVRGGLSSVQSQIAAQPYVEATLPVLSRSEKEETILLNDELIISFRPELSVAQRQAILSAQNLEQIRPIPLTQNHYLVRAKGARGLESLNIANKLANVNGIATVSPNFIQQANPIPAPIKIPTNPTPQNPLPSLLPSNNPTQRSLTSQSPLFALQWHLRSQPMQFCLNQNYPSSEDLIKCLLTESKAKTQRNLPATDLRVLPVWERGNQGRGVVVAVVDSLIEWDHPSLRDSLYKVESADRCPGEIYGWDFSSMGSLAKNAKICDLGDPETRTDEDEFTFLRNRLEATFLLSDRELIAENSSTATKIQRNNPGISDAQVAQMLRERIHSQLRGEFHGTSVSSVVAAQPTEELGVMGTAPEAKILPVRVMGMNGSFSTEAYLVGLLYAASRGADVINISLGGAPTDTEANVIAEILKDHPELVIVASSGNDDSNKPNYPAAYSGILSVGATNLQGQRAPYSSFGETLNVVGPGGDTSERSLGGILVAGGTGLPNLWRNIPADASMTGYVFDRAGKHFWTEGTSFASPAVAGVVALMKAADPQRKLTRAQMIQILQRTANRSGLSLSDSDRSLFERAVQQQKIKAGNGAEAFFFGSGLVDAEAAVAEVWRLVR
jgi:serine protease